MTQQNKPNPIPTYLRYKGKDGYPFIMGVPARDLDIEDIYQASFTLNITAGELVERLSTGKQLNGGSLYEREDIYLCIECGKEYKTWDGLHNHVLTKHTEVENFPPAFPVEIEPSIDTEDEDNDTSV